MADNTVQHWTFALPDGNANALPFAGAAGPVGGVLKALSTNAATIFVGGTGVTKTGLATDGLPLAPGDQVNVADLVNTGALKVIGTAGDKVAFLGSSS